MNNNEGLVELKNVKDYFNKLLHDYNLLKQHPNDIYLGFNFIVTANHIKDWRFPPTHPEFIPEHKRLNLIPLIRICGMIASGIKHFEIIDKKNTSAINKEDNKYTEVSYLKEDPLENSIVIESQNGETITLIDFANDIINFWSSEMAAFLKD